MLPYDPVIMKMIGSESPPPYMGLSSLTSGLWSWLLRHCLTTRGEVDPNSSFLSLPTFYRRNHLQYGICSFLKITNQSGMLPSGKRLLKTMENHQFGHWKTHLTWPFRQRADWFLSSSTGQRWSAPRRSWGSNPAGCYRGPLQDWSPNRRKMICGIPSIIVYLVVTAVSKDLFMNQ